jgi:RimJ/RimL family protein N-acetyltransferase
MLTFQVENVDELQEAKDTEFGFNNRCGVIRESDAVVGFYNFYIDSPELHLQEIEILVEYQGNGYGTEFVKLLFEHHPEVNVITGHTP